MKVLLDTNIILDYGLERSPIYENAQKILHLVYSNEIEAFVSASTVKENYYFVQKFKS